MKRKPIVTLLITGLLASGLSAFAFAATTGDNIADPKSTLETCSEIADAEETEAEEIVSVDTRPGMTEKRMQALAEQQAREAAEKAARESDPQWMAAQNARKAALEARIDIEEAALAATLATLENPISLDSIINFGIHQFETNSSDGFLVTNVVYTSMDVDDGSPRLLNLYVDYDMASTFNTLFGATEAFVCKTQVKIYYNGGSSSAVLTDASDVYRLSAFTDGYENYEYTVDLSSYSNITRVYVTTRIETTADSVAYYPLALNKTLAQILAQGNG